MDYAQTTQAEYPNASHLPKPRLEVGSQVSLLRKDIHTTLLSVKIDHKKVGKFKILERIRTHAYHLELPASMKINPIFHVSLLEPVNVNPLPSHHQPPLPPVIVEGEEEPEVEEILDSRIRCSRLEYLVKWIGNHQATWYPASNLYSKLAPFHGFHGLYPAKPSAPPTRAPRPCRH